MQTHKKKKIEILVEAPFEEKLTRLLEELGVKGFTVFPVISGKGEHGNWSRRGLVNDVGQMLLIVTIIDTERANEIAEAIHNSIRDHQGVITLSDVEVFRGEKF